MTPSTMFRVSAATLLGALALSVSCSNDGAGGGGTGAASGAGNDGPGLGLGFSTPCDSDDDCSGDQYCSVEDVCVPSGKCAGSGDCEAGEVCGAGSNTCLSEGACLVEDDCTGGTVCDEDAGECVIGEGCGANEFEADRQAPNVMIVMDRSGSMGTSAGSEGNRWEVAKLAVDEMIAEFSDKASFGLNTYSSCVSDGCSAGSIVVGISDDASAVSSYLEDKAGCGSGDGQGTNGSGDICYLCNSGDPETSTGKTLASLVGAEQLQDPNRANVVLLLTDGSESGECIEDEVDGEAAAKALFEQQVPVRTHVVGFSNDVDEDALTAVAQAGGTADFVSANDLSSLKQAFEDIVRSVLSCEFQLEEEPPNGDELYVYLENEPTPLERDADEGWTYDAEANRVALHGQLCSDLKAGKVADVDIIFGCPTRDVK